MRFLILTIALAACGHPPVKPVPENKKMTTSSDPQPAPVVVARSATEWSIEVKRVLGTQSASARILVTIAPAAASPAPHSAVASAVAWLSLTRVALTGGAPSDAVDSARHGIADLGDTYRPKGVKDDTGLHLLDANSMIASGKTAEGAEELASILDARIGLYFRRYKDEVRRLEGE